MTKLLIVTPDGRTVEYRDLDEDGRMDVAIALDALRFEIEEYETGQEDNEEWTDETCDCWDLRD